MSNRSQRDEVGTELIRAAKEQPSEEMSQEDKFMCRMAAMVMTCFYARGRVFFQSVCTDPPYESAQPNYPITVEAGSGMPAEVPRRELTRTWRIHGQFGRLPKGRRHMRSERTDGVILPNPREIVDFATDIECYFHSYLRGWEPGIVEVTLFEGNQPEPITAIVECKNATCMKEGTLIYRPTMSIVQ